MVVSCDLLQKQKEIAMDKSIEEGWTPWTPCSVKYLLDIRHREKGLYGTGTHSIRARQIQVDEFEIDHLLEPDYHGLYKLIDNFFYIGDLNDIPSHLNKDMKRELQFNAETMHTVLLWANAIWNG